MQINFYPESDNLDFEKSAKEYKEIWKQEGQRITEAIEKISGLKFKEKIINAVISAKTSYSRPLQLQSSLQFNIKKGGIVHELCHRILVANRINWGELPEDSFEWNIAIHKPVMLILYDIWTELYGEDFAKENVAYESTPQKEEKITPYKVVWDWALAMTKEKRHEEFLKYLSK